MQTDQPFGVAQARADLLQRNAGGIGGQQRLRSDPVLKIGEDPSLEIDVLGHRLDHQVGAAQPLTVRIRHQSVPSVPHPAPIAQTPLEERVGALHGTPDLFHRDVLEPDLQPLKGAPGGDVATHDARPDHMNPLRALRGGGRQSF